MSTRSTSSSGMSSRLGAAGRPAAEPQVRGADRVPGAISTARSMRVIELAHVARPGVVRERLDRLGLEAARAASGTGRRSAARKCSASGGMSSRRSRSGGSRISMVLSRKSRSSRNRPAATSAARSALVAERMRTSILPRARGAHPLELAASRARGAAWPAAGAASVADLVQQQGAAVGQLEAADAVGARVGEGALHVAEHLALEQRPRTGRPGSPRRAAAPRAARRRGSTGPRPPCRCRARR